LDKQLTKSRFTVSVFYFISGIIFASFTSRIPGIQQKFMLNDASLGLMLASIPAGLMISMPFAGYFTNRFKMRSLLLSAAVAYSILLLCLGYASAAWQVSVVLFLFGVSRTFFNVSVNTCSIVLQQQFKRSIVTSFHGIWSLAALLGALLSMILIGWDVSMENHFLMVSIFSVIAVFVFNASIPETGKGQPKKKLFSAANKGLLQLGFIAAGSMFCEGMMSDWSGIYFSKVGGVTGQFYVLGYASYLTTMVLGRFLGDWFLGKYGEMTMVRASAILLGMGFLLAVVLPDPILIVIGFLLVGLGVSCFVPMIFLLASKNAEVPIGTAVSSVSLLGYVGFLIGPPIIGYLSETFGLQAAFFSSILVAILVGIVAMRFKQTQPKS
jgi:MFS family permease